MRKIFFFTILALFLVSTVSAEVINGSKTFTTNEDFFNYSATNIIFDNSIKLKTYSDEFDRATSLLQNVTLSNESAMEWIEIPINDAYNYIGEPNVYLNNGQLYVDKPDVTGQGSDEVDIVGIFPQRDAGQITIKNIELTQYSGTSTRWNGRLVIGENLYNRSTIYGSYGETLWYVHSPDPTHNSNPLFTISYNYNKIYYQCNGQTANLYNWDFKGISHNVTVAWNTTSDMMWFYVNGNLIGSDTLCDDTEIVNTIALNTYGNQCYASGNGVCSIRMTVDEVLVESDITHGTYEDLVQYQSVEGEFFEKIWIDLDKVDGDVSFSFADDGINWSNWVSLDDGMNNISLYEPDLIDTFYYKYELNGTGIKAPEILEYTIYTDCPESWQPYYTNCTIGDNHTLYYLDENECGSYEDLPVDNGTVSSCNYCILQYSFDETCVNYNLIQYPVYDNFETCCNVTGIADDCDLPANTTLQSCTGIHQSNEISGLVIDFGAEFGITMIAMVGIIALIGIGTFAVKKLKLK